jgi:hypothetical protein
VDEPLLIQLDGVSAKVVALDRGAAAIIGASDNAADELRAQLQAGMTALDVDA